MKRTESLVPNQLVGIYIPFKGDTSYGSPERGHHIFVIFDPHSNIASKNYKRFDLSMSVWMDNEQREAVVDCMIQAPDYFNQFLGVLCDFEVMTSST